MVEFLLLHKFNLITMFLYLFMWLPPFLARYCQLFSAIYGLCSDSYSVHYIVCTYIHYCGLFCCLSLMAQQSACGLYKRDRQTQTTIVAHLADG